MRVDVEIGLIVQELVSFAIYRIGCGIGCSYSSWRVGNPPALAGEGHRSFLTMLINAMEICHLPLQRRHWLLASPNISSCTYYKLV